MKRVLVIADDLSGAAETAGIGVRFGLATHLLRDPPSEMPHANLLVIDTDSRLLLPADAAATVGRFVERRAADDFDLVYKKTDSALRGPVVAEVEAIMGALEFTSALLVPQNPSRKRTIEDGIYRIDGVPLNQTAFANDPIHPARSADVLELLGRSATQPIRCLAPDDDLPPDGITIGAARIVQDVRRWACLFADVAERGHQALLPVGGADFFQAILEARGGRATRPILTKISGNPRLLVCGSTSHAELVARATAERAAVCPITKIDASQRYEQVLSALETHGAAVLVVDQPIDRAPGVAKRIEAALAEMVAAVLSRQRIEHLFLEGGATASAVCRRMGWNELAICGELATGVVQMRTAGGQMLTVKPGSYPWPDAVWS
jgi:uncharacterized protein YgbK (DUF1537 family)